MSALFDVLAFAIFIAGIIGIVRWKGMLPTFQPFIILIWLACINEALSYILVANGYNTIVNNNVYVLLESATIVWFFKRQGIFKQHPYSHLILTIAFVCFWVGETFIWKNKYGFDAQFQIFYSFVFVLMSIVTINRILIIGQQHLLTNALFLICGGFILYFTFSVIVHVFWLYGLTQSVDFIQNIFTIKLIVNFISNLIYALAVLRIPRYKKY
jgi:hypothetical protein